MSYKSHRDILNTGFNNAHAAPYVCIELDGVKPDPKLYSGVSRIITVLKIH